MENPPFDKSVFINCPFDKQFEPILQAILFCVIYAGFTPRIATESGDAAEVRLHKIRDMIVASKFSIHDLSRIQSAKKGEFFRLNMPFELGLDYGCREFFGGAQSTKRMLILETKPYRYQAALSDLAGCDIETHSDDYQLAVRKVRNWLVSEAGLELRGATGVLGAYADFQEWYYERQLAAGFSDDDIMDYPTSELLKAMSQWMDEGQPI